MQDFNETAEPGRVLGPETARPTKEEMTALAYEFWKARGCPQWLWGGLPVRRPLSTLHGANR
jgi:hypothetical protein